MGDVESDNNDMIDESSDDKEYENMVHQKLLKVKQMMLYAALGVTILIKYYLKYLNKNIPRSSLCSCRQWLQEVFFTPSESYRILQMKAHVFQSR